MSKHTLIIISLVFSMILVAMPVSAQDGGDEVELTPTEVSIEAEDGLVLIGDYYLPSGEMDGEAVPVVLMMHMLNARRADWSPLIPILVNEYHFAVLNIDMRGHGDTGGSQDWALAESDVQTLVDWLGEQNEINPDAITILGASIGSNLALRGWANDENILTAIALSPGLDYRGVTTEDAVEAGSDRAVMLVASRQDTASAVSVATLFTATTADVQVRLFSGRLHGTQLLSDESILAELGHSIGTWIIAQME